MDRAGLARLLGASSDLAVRAGGPVIIVEREPLAFKRAFAAAVAGGAPVFLTDPEWAQKQRKELEFILTNVETAPPGERGWLMIPTGGTTGGVRFARHDQSTLASAVKGFCAHFGLNRVNAVGVLPLYHVSGLMAWMRCAFTGGTFVPGNWKEIEAGRRPACDGGDWVTSLVPTQLQRLLSSPAAVEWLREFTVIFLGGGPVWPELADEAAKARLPVPLSYGMTETAAMIAALRPTEFLAGGRSCGLALPHVRLRLTAEETIEIESESVCRGYFPALQDERRFVTQDLGRFDAQRHLHVLGRRDSVIITGGKKVFPNEVEAALRASGEFIDVAVIGVPDREWGEAVVACYEATQHAPDLAKAVATVPAHQRPKRFVPVRDWPRNLQGKVNRAALRVVAGGD